MVPHSSILAWRIHGQRSLLGYVHGVANSWTQLTLSFTFSDKGVSALIELGAQSFQVETSKMGPKAVLLGGLWRLCYKHMVDKSLANHGN